MADDVIERYRRVLETGSAGALRDWATTGRAGLIVLRDDLTGRVVPDLGTGVHPRDVLDNLGAAVAAIAETEPETFLEVFADERFDADSFVLTGLGRIDDPRATARLAGASAADDETIRMHAAIGLGRRAAPEATTALVSLLDDRSYLVRYHALRSLARVGDAAALPALVAFARPAPIEQALAAEAIAAIESRASHEQPTG